VCLAADADPRGEEALQVLQCLAVGLGVVHAHAQQALGRATRHLLGDGPVHVHEVLSVLAHTGGVDHLQWCA
jgi:hypothetical protein